MLSCSLVRAGFKSAARWRRKFGSPRGLKPAARLRCKLAHGGLAIAVCCLLLALVLSTALAERPEQDGKQPKAPAKETKRAEQPEQATQTAEADTEPVPAETAEKAITDEDVEQAIGKAVAYLSSRQRFNGRWHSPQFERTFPNGLTALAAYTLKSAGVPLDDLRIRRAGLALLDRSAVRTVFARSFTLRFFCSVDPERLSKEIAEDVHFLTLQQGENGGWGFGTLAGTGPGKEWTDSFHSHLALHALSQAASHGAGVSATVWRQAEKSLLSGVNPDGGWGYPLTNDPEFAYYPRDSNGSMTAGGLASLYCLYNRLYLDAGYAFNGRFKARCGRDLEKTGAIRAVMGGARHWLTENFTTEKVPGYRAGPAGDLIGGGYVSYYLYCVSRVGTASGRKRFGDTAWYPEVARRLVSTQLTDGSWGNMYETCFAVLALIEGRTPLLINKLEYGEGEEWNRDPRDAANLTLWLSRRSGTPLTWQVVDAAAHLEDLGDAPVLLITGHEAPALNEKQQAALGDFILDGGTVLAVACCSREAFTEGCTGLFTTLLPRHVQEPLPEDHPVWTLNGKVAPSDEVIGFFDGCRTSVFLLKRGACCAWQQNLHDRYEELFLLADNILRYATFGRPFPGRLTPYFGNPTAPPPQQTISVARLRHGGDWWADPNALQHLSAALAADCGLGIDEKPAVSAAGARRSKARVLYLTGHDFQPPSRNGRLQLKSFLVSGGTLIASACCGRQAFDDAFRPFAENLFGADAFRAIDPQDPLITGAFAPGVARSTLKPLIKPRIGALEGQRFEWPELFGVKHKDRWVVIYSPLDINCGISGHACATCVGYAQDDAEAIVRNLLLYAAKAGQAEATPAATRRSSRP